MSTPNLPPLPKPDTHCFDDDTGKDVWNHSPVQTQAYAIAAIQAQGVPDGWREEAKNLASILAGIGEGSYDLETLYTECQADGDGFVRRAADLLKLIASAPPAPQAAEKFEACSQRCEAHPGCLCGEQSSVVRPDTLYLLRRLLSNQHTLSGPEFREELARIVETAYSVPQAEDDSAASVNDTNAALAGRYFELLKVVEQYEKSGVTCQTFWHFISGPCAECNSPGICGKQVSVLQQEPVAWLHPANATCVTTDPTAYARGIPLYTCPIQQANPQPLSDEQINHEALLVQKLGHLGWEGFHAGVRYAETHNWVKEKT